MKWFIDTLYAMYLGGMMGLLFGGGILNWRIWIILVPTLFFVEWKCREQVKRVYKDMCRKCCIRRT